MKWKIKSQEDKLYKELKDRKPLPMGRKEFDAWSDRIISLAKIPGATAESLKFALAEMVMHLGPHESHKEDAHFVHGLRKGAVNQVAYAVMSETRERAKERLAAQEEQIKQKLDETKILANQ